MLLVNDVVFSRGAWEWMASKVGEAKQFSQQSDTIASFFRPYLNNKEIMNGIKRKDEYQELTCGEMWEMFYNVFCLMSDIIKPGTLPRLSSSATTSDLENELKAIERAMCYWCLMKGFKEDVELVGLRKEFLSISRDATNMLFCIYVYCMMNSIWLKFEGLKEILHGREVPTMPKRSKLPLTEQFNYNEYRYDENACDEFMRDVIRECCSGDFNDFIISIKDRIADKTIDDYQIELAKVKGYESMSMRTFPDMEKKEAWRRIFTTYFDDEETNYTLFYQTFTRQCYEFVLLSYLSIANMGSVSYIPVYGIYSDNNFEDSYEQSIKKMINTKLIRGKILSLYNKRIT